MANSGNYRGDNNDTKILGSDGTTEIGNVGDRLKVDASLSFSGTSTLPRISNKLRYDDMNVSTGGVARGTIITTASGYNTLYDHSGSGIFIGLAVTLEESAQWNIRLTLDSEVIFDLYTGDIDSAAIYGYTYNSSANMEPGRLGISGSKDTFYFQPPQNTAIDYSTNVKIELSKVIGSDKKFRAGFVTLTKET